MIDILFDLLASLVIEVALPMAAEAVIEAGLETAGKGFKKKNSADPLVAAVSLAVTGGLCGLLVSSALPRRLIPQVDLHGFGIVVAAVVAGLVMMRYGTWREMNGGSPSYLATFWGGALFAAAMSFTRWMIVG